MWRAPENAGNAYLVQIGTVLSYPIIKDELIPQHLLQHTPRPREVVFTLTVGQLEMLYVRWAAARMRVRQELYEPALPIPPYPLPPAWPDEVRAMMVLWIARERRVFEMEMRELEYLLGLRERTGRERTNGWGERTGPNQDWIYSMLSALCKPSPGGGGQPLGWRADIIIELETLAKLIRTYGCAAVQYYLETNQMQILMVVDASNSDRTQFSMLSEELAPSVGRVAKTRLPDVRMEDNLGRLGVLMVRQHLETGKEWNAFNILHFVDKGGIGKPVVVFVNPGGLKRALKPYEGVVTRSKRGWYAPITTGAKSARMASGSRACPKTRLEAPENCTSDDELLKRNLRHIHTTFVKRDCMTEIVHCCSGPELRRPWRRTERKILDAGHLFLKRIVLLFAWTPWKVKAALVRNSIGPEEELFACVADKDTGYKLADVSSWYKFLWIPIRDDCSKLLIDLSPPVPHQIRKIAGKKVSRSTTTWAGDLMMSSNGLDRARSMPGGKSPVENIKCFFHADVSHFQHMFPENWADAAPNCEIKSLTQNFEKNRYTNVEQ
ncbi:uncharacterized protein F5147DRAFT_817021 [Suillus discolor]|uniref:Uncharacterized protein n=1 Tax=Suillus discolor TaxID=1912936 RepID=A0A9P7JPE7_9AGAM|nr:uncharacterized protein F5147DRAFT_817021 [Suillus discolor]KAG2096686.1 hypothetical protein F5147DRAFT_817021 [Suillus discolor]